MPFHGTRVASKALAAVPMEKFWFRAAMMAQFPCSMLHLADLCHRYNASSSGRFLAKHKIDRAKWTEGINLTQLQVKRLAFSPNGSILASAHSENVVALWSR